MLLRSAPRAPRIYPLLAIVVTHWLIDISHKNVNSVKQGYYLIPSTENIGVLVSRPLAESEGKVTQVVLPIKSNLLLGITEESFGIWLQAWLGPSTQKYMCLRLEPFFLSPCINFRQLLTLGYQDGDQEASCFKRREFLFLSYSSLSTRCQNNLLWWIHLWSHVLSNSLLLEGQKSSNWYELSTNNDLPSMWNLKVLTSHLV